MVIHIEKDIHQRIKIIAAQKRIGLAILIENILKDFADKEENKKALI
jgi:hypothetical protein